MNTERLKSGAGKYGPPLITILTIVAVGGVVLETQVEAIEKFAEKKCDQRFGKNNWTWISHTTDKGPIKCMDQETGKIYEPEIHLVNGSTGPLDTIRNVLMAPISIMKPIPSWLIWTVTAYIFLSIFPFGCPYCGLPDLAWGPKLVSRIWNEIRDTEAE